MKYIQTLQVPITLQLKVLKLRGKQFFWALRSLSKANTSHHHHISIIYKLCPIMSPFSLLQYLLNTLRLHIYIYVYVYVYMYSSILVILGQIEYGHCKQILTKMNIFLNIPHYIGFRVILVSMNDDCCCHESFAHDDHHVPNILSFSVQYSS